MSNKRDTLDWSKSFMYLLHKTYFLIEKKLEHKLHEDKGISFSQFLILLGVHCKKSASQNDIAEFLFLTEATVSRHVSVLHKSRYLKRIDDKKNRRKYILLLTPLGLRKFSRAHALIENELHSIFNVIKLSKRNSISAAFTDVLQQLTS